MKKLLYLTFLTFSLTCLVACGDDDDNDDGGGTSTSKFDDWNDPKSPNYKPQGYNPIEGEWRVDNIYSKTIFTSDFKMLETWYANGEWELPTYITTYKINDKVFETERLITYPGGDMYKHKYELTTENGNEYLTITYPKGKMKYKRVK